MSQSDIAACERYCTSLSSESLRQRKAENLGCYAGTISVLNNEAGAEITACVGVQYLPQSQLCNSLDSQGGFVVNDMWTSAFRGRDCASVVGSNPGMSFNRSCQSSTTDTMKPQWGSFAATIMSKSSLEDRRTPIVCAGYTTPTWSRDHAISTSIVTPRPVTGL